MSRSRRLRRTRRSRDGAGAAAILAIDVRLATIVAMRPDRPLPKQIAGIAVPQDAISLATWRQAEQALPGYLLAHSVRSYCWGAGIAAREGWSFDRRILWTASLLHDTGLTTIPRNASCFEVEGGRSARRFLERAGLPSGGGGSRGSRHRAPHATLGHPRRWRRSGPARSWPPGSTFAEPGTSSLTTSGRPSSVRSLGRHSTAGSSPPSPARRTVDRPARARACSTTRAWPPGWPGRRGERDAADRT